MIRTECQDFIYTSNRTQNPILSINDDDLRIHRDWIMSEMRDFQVDDTDQIRSVVHRLNRRLKGCALHP